MSRATSRARHEERARACGLLVAFVFSVSAFGCATREIPPRGPTFDDVRPALEAACVDCHGDARSEAGYRIDRYLRAIACPAGSSAPAVEPRDERSALLSVLERADHAGLLGPSETLLVSAWVADGAPARVGAAHAAGFVDPRSPDFHGAVLRAERWARMLDPGEGAACSQCHAGAAPPPAPDRARRTAPDATACTSCHVEPDGPFACSTCHGSEGHAFPPRDPCFHPDEAARGGAHALHDARGVACATCHGERHVDWLAAGVHGNGSIDVALDPARAGDGATFDRSTGTCATACHDRGGSRPGPRWAADAGLDCASCHASPPAGHYAGTCDGCHAEAAADGTALTPGRLHVNGIVDLGDGTGGCGACHGQADDPTPTTGAHAAHAMPMLALGFECAECHTTPTEVGALGHLDATPGAEVAFGALATARASTPTHDPSSGSCSSVACHGAGLGGATVPTPRWSDTSGAAATCGACHGAPPPPPHTSARTCSAVSCHGGLSTPGPGVSELGRAVHVDARIDLWLGR